jgi:hypothetical protein
MSALIVPLLYPDSACPFGWLPLPFSTFLAFGIFLEHAHHESKWRSERGRAQPVEHGLQVNESKGCSKVQGCESADHLQSTLASYNHPVPFAH